MSEQATLPLAEPAGIEAAFWRFHHENPDVYRELVRLARGLHQRGNRKVGMKMLFEVVRWQRAMLDTRSPAPFKLNNNHTAYYARLIMEREPDLAGIFDTRQLGVGGHYVP